MLIIYLLIALLSLNAFAAIVSDNDGSAFVTKSEFEAFKADFERQILNYNLSIDQKIDGAIATYLAGINLNVRETLQNCTSILKYPLNVYMNSKYYFYK